MKDQLLKTMACPLCHNALRYDSKQNVMVCDHDQLAFPIENEIPVLLPESGRPLSDRPAIEKSSQPSSTGFTVIIPARFASTRLPGKPLLEIQGKPMILHVVDQARQSQAQRVIVATDDQAVYDVVSAYGAEVVLTRTDHQSGTERLAEVIALTQLSGDEIIVNVQGDEPLIPPELIDQVAHNIASHRCPMATLSVPITESSELFNPNAVKVVQDQNGYALYFSRAAVPWDRDGFAEQRERLQTVYHRHIGIYAYRADFIQQYVAWDPSPIEQIEMLEQLRVLWYGEKIHVAQAICAPGVGVDTAEDLEAVRRLMAEASNTGPSDD